MRGLTLDDIGGDVKIASSLDIGHAQSESDLLKNPDLEIDGIERGVTPLPQAPSVPVASFKQMWYAMHGPDLLEEYKFHPTRDWRFDFAHIDAKIAIEIEGGIWVQGRHVRPKGYSEDCTKYNEAQLMGWQVYRFTSENMGIVAIAKIIKKIRESVVSTD